MRTKLKKSLSILLALVMLVGLLPTVAFAADQSLSNTDASGTGWTYTGTTKVLKLDGYSGSDRFTLLNAGSVIDVSGINTITINAANDSAGIRAIVAKNTLEIRGSGTLNININAPANMNSGHDIRAIDAQKGLVITDGVTVNINVSSQSDRTGYGIRAENGIQVKSYAKLGVSMDMPATATQSYAVYTHSGKIEFSGSATKTITNTVGESANSSIYGIYNAAVDSSAANNGDISISGGKVTITMSGNKGSGICTSNQYSGGAGSNADGTISLDTATVEISGGYYGIQNLSDKRSTDSADVVVKDSSLKIKTNGTSSRSIGSLRNGILLNNSTVELQGSIDLGGNAGAGSENQSAYGLKISSGKPVTITDDTAPIVIPGDTRYNKVVDLALSEGGSVTMKATSTPTTYCWYVSVGDNVECTIGTYYKDDSRYKHSTLDAYQACLDRTSTSATCGTLKFEYRASATPTEISVPKAKTGLVYNGTLQTGVESGEGYTLTGPTSATNAGDYTATATLNTGYIWTGGSREPQEINWSIAKKTPTAADFTFTRPTDLVYDGHAKTATVELNSPYTDCGEIKIWYVRSGRANETIRNAGDCTVKIDVAGGNNFKPAENLTDDSWTFTILKANQAAPTGLEGVSPTTIGGSDGKITGLNGLIEYQYKLITEPDSDYITVGSETTTIASLKAGTYQVRFAGTINYNPGEPATVTVPAYHPARPTISVSGTYTYNGNTQTATVNGYDSTTMNIEGNTGKDAGDYTVSVTSKTGQWADGSTGAVTAAWSIAKKEITPAIIAYDKTYDSTTAAEVSVYFTGLVNSESLTKNEDYEFTSANFDNANVGTDKTVTVNNLTLKNTSKTKNYVLSATSATKTANITQRTVSLSWYGYQDLIYTGEPVNVTATANFLSPADSGSTVTVTGGNAIDAGTYTANEATATCVVEGKRYNPPVGYDVDVEDADNGTVSVNYDRAAVGDEVTITVTPDKGYELDTLTVLDKDGKEIKLTEKDGEYTFEMPDGKVTVKASFKKIAVVNPFVDVKPGDYFYNAVLWAVEKDITSGTSATTFSPNDPCTRAQIVTFLWRAAGSPEAKNAVNFSDVAADAYYAKAVAWAVEQGITKGTSETTFSPDATCTRAQAVTFLSRALKGTAAAGNTFADVDADSYYAEAVAWAVANDITYGTSAATFSPDADCTRGQIVTFLFRAMAE